MSSIGSQLRRHIELLKRYPALSPIGEDILRAYFFMEACYKNGGKLLIAGNGGSAADAEHIVGELMKSFELPRKLSKRLIDSMIAIDATRGNELAVKLQDGLPAIALQNHPALNTAYANDVDGLLCYAQQVHVYGQKPDVFLAISTSGNSQNLLYAAVAAKAKNMKIIGLTGDRPSMLSQIADVTVRVPETVTYRIQELHLPIYHCWCLMLEDCFFGCSKY
nr:SIS domain-containing protein [Syntrophobotulus glycolicus]